METGITRKSVKTCFDVEFIFLLCLYCRTNSHVESAFFVCGTKELVGTRRVSIGFYTNFCRMGCCLVCLNLFLYLYV